MDREVLDFEIQGAIYKTSILVNGKVGHMKVIQSNGQIDEEGFLRLDLSTQLPPGEVNLVIVIHPDKTGGRTYDFSELAGKLKWQGDAVKVQRQLRDEW